MKVCAHLGRADRLLCPTINGRHNCPADDFDCILSPCAAGSIPGMQVAVNAKPSCHTHVFDDNHPITTYLVHPFPKVFGSKNRMLEGATLELFHIEIERAWHITATASVKKGPFGYFAHHSLNPSRQRGAKKNAPSCMNIVYPRSVVVPVIYSTWSCGIRCNQAHSCTVGKTLKDQSNLNQGDI